MEKEKKEERIKPDTPVGNTILWILVCILIVAVIAQGYQLSSVDRQIGVLATFIDRQQKKEMQLTQDISQVQGESQKVMQALEVVKENAGILWYASLPKTSLDKIVNWWKVNTQFKNCDVQPTTLSIQNGFLGYAGAYGDTLVVEYPDRGYQVTNRNGEIKCYKFPIETATPSATSCLDLCKQKGAE